MLIIACDEEPEAGAQVGRCQEIHGVLEQRHISYGNMEGLLDVLKERNNLGREGKPSVETLGVGLKIKVSV